MYDHARLFARVAAALALDPGASLRRLARGLRIHPHTVAQVIREHTGTTFSEWRTRQRVADACTLLRTHPDLSIKEVSAAAGFSSTSVFDRFLRRTCGRSPSECRLAAATSASERGSVAPLACGRPAGSNINELDGRSTDAGVRPDDDRRRLESTAASS
jgi:AraC-like DNA-binding protein